MGEGVDRWSVCGWRLGLDEVLEEDVQAAKRGTCF